MLKVLIKIVLLFLLPLQSFSQDIYTIHTSRDKTNLLKVEKLGNKFFVFFYDSTFFEKRIKCKIFDREQSKVINEFFITPKTSSYQDEIKTLIISDKLIYLTFVDYRSDGDGDLYSQLIDERGILWDSGGIPVCVQKGKQKNFSIASDKQNLFIVWEDYRNDASGDIYAQKFDFFGNALWKENGLVVTNLDGAETEPKVVSNNSGGCYVSWIEKILKVHKLYVQALDPSGKKMFGQYGIFVSNPEASSIQNFLLTDENDELIIFHTDVSGNPKIYFQRLSKKGTKKIGLSGKQLCSKTGNQEILDIKNFGQNEFVILFSVEEKSGYKNSFMQILSSGDKLRFKSPIKINSDCKFHQKPMLRLDENGFFIFWTCIEEENNMINLFIQTITAKGEILKLNGLKLNDEGLLPDSKFFLFLDNPIDCVASHLNHKNGIFFVHFYLSDYKNPKIQNFNVNYYEGLVKLSWELINERPGTKLIIEKLFEDDKSWIEVYNFQANSKSSFKKMNFDDQIFESESVKYRLRLLDPEGNETIVEEELSSEPIPEGFFLYQNSPNPFSTSTKIAFRLPVKSKVVIKLYNSRLEEIATIFDEFKDAGLHEFEFTPLPSMQSGIYFYRISASGFYDVKKMIYTK
ncbi:MAG: hypothetical protein N3F03_05245 [Ignavibacteria bacterium]|nr:hypothetical protein [Ignavibacteria bacterium]